MVDGFWDGRANATVEDMPKVQLASPVTRWKTLPVKPFDAASPPACRNPTPRRTARPARVRPHHRRNRPVSVRSHRHRPQGRAAGSARLHVTRGAARPTATHPPNAASSRSLCCAAAPAPTTAASPTSLAQSRTHPTPSAGESSVADDSHAIAAIYGLELARRPYRRSQPGGSPGRSEASSPPNCRPKQGAGGDQPPTDDSHALAHRPDHGTRREAR